MPKQKSKLPICTPETFQRITGRIRHAKECLAKAEYAAIAEDPCSLGEITLHLINAAASIHETRIIVAGCYDAAMLPQRAKP